MPGQHPKPTYEQLMREAAEDRPKARTMLARRQRLSEMTIEQLEVRTEEFRAMAAGATTARTRDALTALVGRMERLIEARKLGRDSDAV